MRAHRAGLQAGDVIVSVDGHSIDSIGSLSSKLGENRIQLEIVRYTKVKTVSVRFQDTEAESGKGESLHF